VVCVCGVCVGRSLACILRVCMIVIGLFVGLLSVSIAELESRQGKLSWKVGQDDRHDSSRGYVVGSWFFDRYAFEKLSSSKDATLFVGTRNKNSCCE